MAHPIRVSNPVEFADVQEYFKAEYSLVFLTEQPEAIAAQG